MLGDEVLACLRVLAGNPQFQLAILKVRGAVLRLQWSVCQEWVAVTGLQLALGSLQPGGGIAIAAQFLALASVQQGCCRGGVLGIAVAFGGRQVPGQFQQAPRFLRLPVGTRHHGYAIYQRIAAAYPLQAQHRHHTGCGFSCREVRVSEAATMSRCAFEDGMEHARQTHVDTEQGVSVDDFGRVYAALRLADNLEIRCWLQRYGAQLGHGQGRCCCGQFSVGPVLLAGGVMHAPLLGGEFG